MLLFQMLISKDTESVLTQISHVTYLTAFGSEVTADIQVQIKAFPRELGCGAQHACPTQVHLARMADLAAGLPSDISYANDDEVDCECAKSPRCESVKDCETALVHKWFEKVSRCESGCVKGCEVTHVCVMCAEVL